MELEAPGFLTGQIERILETLEALQHLRQRSSLVLCGAEGSSVCGGNTGTGKGRDFIFSFICGMIFFLSLFFCDPRGKVPDDPSHSATDSVDSNRCSLTQNFLSSSSTDGRRHPIPKLSPSWRNSWRCTRGELSRSSIIRDDLWIGGSHSMDP